jgi:hypothetical protein
LHSFISMSSPLCSPNKTFRAVFALELVSG